MNKLMLAAGVAALCATSAPFAQPAEAGMRFGGGGFGFRHFHFRPHFYTPPTVYSAPQDDEVHVRRSRKTHSKTVKSRPKPEPKVPLVKFADGTGRQYDPASKVWFDGKLQCFSGQHPFTFKNDAWFYGRSSWTLKDGNWLASGDAQPEPVSCESVEKFAAKANANAAKTLAESDKQESASKPAPDLPIKKPVASSTIKTAEGAPAAIASKPAAAPETECKKYFPSVGQMLTVPCGE